MRPCWHGNPLSEWAVTGLEEVHAMKLRWRCRKQAASKRPFCGSMRSSQGRRGLGSPMRDSGKCRRSSHWGAGRKPQRRQTSCLRDIPAWQRPVRAKPSRVRGRRVPPSEASRKWMSAGRGLAAPPDHPSQFRVQTTCECSPSRCYSWRISIWPSPSMSRPTLETWPPSKYSQ